MPQRDQRIDAGRASRRKEGGGHGHPFDRPPAEVLEDVLGGFVSQAAAARFYGVVIDGESVDAQATAARRKERPPVRAFHRNEYVDVLV